MKANVRDKKPREAPKEGILDRLPAEVAATIDRIGFEFLHSHGYNTRGEEISERLLNRIQREMRRRGEALDIITKNDPRDGALYVHFELWRGDVLIEKTKSIKLVFGQIGGKR